MVFVSCWETLRRASKAIIITQTSRGKMRKCFLACFALFSFLFLGLLCSCCHQTGFSWITWSLWKKCELNDIWSWLAWRKFSWAQPRRQQRSSKVIGIHSHHHHHLSDLLQLSRLNNLTCRNRARAQPLFEDNCFDSFFHIVIHHYQLREVADQRLSTLSFLVSSVRPAQIDFDMCLMCHFMHTWCVETLRCRSTCALS